MISTPLLIELHYEIHSPALFVHPFFACYHEVNPRGIRMSCHQAVQALALSRDDTLFSEMEKSNQPQMFFVLQGSLSYVSPDSGTEIVTAGMWISEAELWATNWIHQGTLRAVTDCRLTALNATTFQELVSAFPSPHAGVYADSFVQGLNHEEVATTDIGNQLGLGILCTICERCFPEEWPMIRPEFDRRHGNGSLASIASIRNKSGLASFPINLSWKRDTVSQV